MFKFKSNHGFTLLEAFIAVSIGGAFLSTVISAWYFSTKVWKEESIRTALRVNIEHSMERIKEDIRLSDGNGILFYPSTASSYSAISLPRAAPNTSGYLAFSNGNIAWDNTVIYHVYNNNGVYELRRTTFDTFNSDTVQRQAQLDYIVANGIASGGTVGSATRTLFTSTGPITLEIVPQNPTFDGYGATVQRSGLTSFGSAKLDPGSHQVRFETTGKNAAATDYRMGMDSFTLTPSGGSREAEAVTLVATSGQGTTQENMTAYTGGVWGGNHQLEYQSSAVSQYVTFDAFYDLWLESNFGNVTHSGTEVAGVNPYLALSSRETQGLTPGWQASTQTLSGTQVDEVLGSTQSVRSVINGSALSKSANMIRIKFTAASTSALVINSAYFGLRSGTEATGTGTPNFVGVPIQLFFDNAPVAVGGTDPVGAVGAGLVTGRTVPAGYYVWSNWFQYTMSTTPPVPDYLVSMNILSGSGGTAWTQTSPPLPVYSYRIDDALGTNVVLSPWTPGMPGYSTTAGIFASTEMASWSDSGTATSQVYDTKVSTPPYGQLSWSSSLPVGATVTMKARTSSYADMSDAVAWSAAPTYLVSPASLSGLSARRYVQFQAVFQAAPPYLTYPSVDNVQTSWTSQSALVEVSGVYTKKPNYGQFRVLVDGVPTVKGLEVKLTTNQDYRGKTFTSALNAEEEPKNTGK